MLTSLLTRTFPFAVAACLGLDAPAARADTVGALTLEPARASPPRFLSAARGVFTMRADDGYGGRISDSFVESSFRDTAPASAPHARRDVVLDPAATPAAMPADAPASRPAAPAAFAADMLMAPARTRLAAEASAVWPGVASVDATLPAGRPSAVSPRRRAPRQRTRAPLPALLRRSVPGPRRSPARRTPPSRRGPVRGLAKRPLARQTPLGHRRQTSGHSGRRVSRLRPSSGRSRRA